MGNIEYDFSALDFGPHRDAVLGSTTNALGLAIEHIRAVAIEKTPLDTGNLRGMAFTTVAGLEASLTFPGPYARYQHYELQLKHRVGQALYLEQPMILEADMAMELMGAVIALAGFEDS